MESVTQTAPAELEREFTCYQNTQAIDNLTFQSRIPRIVDTLQTVDTPFLPQANKLIAHAEPTLGQRFSNAFHSLFLQRWKMSLSLQTVSLHHQLMEAEKETLLDELQQRLTLTGKLEDVLAENETAAGRLWDLSAGKLIKTSYKR